MPIDKTISVIAGDRGVAEDGDYVDRGFVDGVAKLFTRRVELPAEDLAARLNGFLSAMNSVLSTLPATLGRFELEEMTLSVEISATGKVSLLGTGGELGASGGLTFTLKRPSAPSTLVGG